MMESLSFSIPVIAPNVGGISEIVNDSDGILLPVAAGRLPELAFVRRFQDWVPAQASVRLRQWIPIPVRPGNSVPAGQTEGKRRASSIKKIRAFSCPYYIDLNRACKDGLLQSLKRKRRGDWRIAGDLAGSQHRSGG